MQGGDICVSIVDTTLVPIAWTTQTRYLGKGAVTATAVQRLGVIHISRQGVVKDRSIYATMDRNKNRNCPSCLTKRGGTHPRNMETNRTR